MPDPQKIASPQCHAPAGHPCTWPGHANPDDTPHAPRVFLAQAPPRTDEDDLR